ncbi:MAG: CPBP family intramembrane metalloprotease [Bacteroidales bacterium]|nr:CPBP family intramembrane metalloprotease [Bacteroidales bacterium]
MKRLLRNQYFLSYSILYIIILALMAFLEHFPVSQPIAVLLIVGVLFSLIAYKVSKSSVTLSFSRPVQKLEWLVITSLLVYITYTLTCGIVQIKSLFSPLFNENEQIREIITLSYKLLLFVIIPFFVYKFAYQFHLKDFGLHVKVKEFFTKKNAVILIVMFLVLFVFQFFLGNGAKPIREGLISNKQLMIGLPLLYIWLLFEVGLVEEFFFRSLVQSRLAVLTQSELGGIFLSGILFGLAHAPGIYMRGGGTLDNLGPNPSLIMSVGYSILVLSVAGFFLSIIWSKTRNLWLVMAIHAFIDLLPGIHEFVNTWKIY